METPDRNEIVINSDGTVNEEQSMSAMLYDIQSMIKEINNFTKKSRYRSLAVTELEQVENWIKKDLENN